MRPVARCDCCPRSRPPRTRGLACLSLGVVPCRGLGRDGWAAMHRHCQASVERWGAGARGRMGRAAAARRLVSAVDTDMLEVESAPGINCLFQGAAGAQVDALSVMSYVRCEFL